MCFIGQFHHSADYYINVAQNYCMFLQYFVVLPKEIVKKS